MAGSSRLLLALLAGAPIAADGTGPPTESAAVRAEYARHAPATRRDAARGRAVSDDVDGAGCIGCHRVRGRGGEAGPDLSNIGGKFAREHLIESVLEPSRQIVEGYRPMIVATEDGRVLTGLVKGETDRRLILIDAQARERIVLKSDVIERQFADDFRPGPDPPVRPGLRARRQPRGPTARRPGHRREVPAPHRIAPEDPLRPPIASGRPAPP
jgi:putative heme-binding domain-containing protein